MLQKDNSENLKLVQKENEETLKLVQKENLHKFKENEQRNMPTGTTCLTDGPSVSQPVDLVRVL